jgi:hypothetical protein
VSFFDPDIWDKDEEGNIKKGQVVFESDVMNKQADKIEKTILAQTVVNQRFIGRKVTGSQVVNDTFSGKLTELKLTFDDGGWVLIKRGEDNNIVLETE